MKKFLLGLGLSLALLSATPAYSAEKCEFPQAKVEKHFTQGGRSLWKLKEDKIPGFLSHVNKLQDVQYEADTIVFASSASTSQMYVLFFKNGCAFGPYALDIPSAQMFFIFNALGIRETDFTEIKVGQSI